MICPQCQGVEEVFDEKHVTSQLRRYRRRGPARTTRVLTDAMVKEGVAGLTMIDIGGGLGAVQHALLEVGVQDVTSVDASTAYLAAAKSEARRRGYAERVTYQHGNFVDLAEDIPPADIVTLDRVICCYHDMENLVSLSATHARKLYGLVYPRDTWWIKIILAIGNLYLRLRGSPFRTFAHPTARVEDLLKEKGLNCHFYSRTLAWQVAVFSR